MSFDLSQEKADDVTAPRPPGSAATTKLRTRSPGRPPAAKRDSREAHLLDVAVMEFLTHGFGGASMARVARAAGVSNKTVYARYTNKDELLLAVVAHLTKGSNEALAAELANPTASPNEVLVSVAMHMAQHWSSPRECGLYRLIIAEAVRFPNLVSLFRESIASLICLLAAYFDAQTRNGTLVLGDATEAVKLFASLAIGEIREQTLFGEPPTPDKMEAMVRSGVDLFLRGSLPRETGRGLKASEEASPWRRS